MPKVHDIAVVAPMWMEYASDLIEGARSYAREHSDLRVVNFPVRSYGESPLPKEGGKFAGILVLANEEDHWVSDAWNSGQPVVNCSGDLIETDVPTVTPDQVIVRSIDYLAGLGRSDLALVCPDVGQSPGFKPLCGTFTRLVKGRGLTPHVFAECDVDPGDAPARLFEPEQETKLARFLTNLTVPAGVWCPTDEIAALVCEVAKLSGLDIPRDLAILGAGDSRAARDAKPPISSFPLPGRAVGYEGMKSLHLLVTEGELPRGRMHVRIPVPEIIERASTALTGNELAIDQARDMILRRGCDGLTINEVVAKVPMSRMTFYQRYKKAFGINPGEHLRSVRLEAAKRLLTESDMSITGVGHACGFDEPNKFYVFFKRETGHSPTEWRGEHGAG